MISHRRSAWGLLALFIVPIFAHAQISLTGLERPLDVSMSPQYPAAGEEIRLSVSSYGIDLERSAIVWFADGKEIARNTKETTVTAGKLGSTINVTVVAEEPGGLIGSGSARIRPTEVDLIWNSDSYAPPYFKGRRFTGSGARVHAEAIARFVRADGSSVAAENIVYSWYRGATRLATGRGRTSVVFPGPSLFTTDDLSVIAQSVDGQYIGRASARISGVDPTVELYENHPLFGVLYHRALTGTVVTSEKEQRVSAVPYSARVATPEDPALTYDWTVSGLRVKPDPEEPQTLSIASNGYSGPLRIELDLTSTSDLFMKARGSWELTFSESSLFSTGGPDDPFARPE
jgi:hypothetical protein